MSRNDFTHEETDWLACFITGIPVDGEFWVVDGPFDVEDNPESGICWVIAANAHKPAGLDNRIKIHTRKDLSPQIGDVFVSITKSSSVDDLYVGVVRR